jgi:dTDP-4-amino-4,6-dideoxygalactose transaminase
MWDPCENPDWLKPVDSRQIISQSTSLLEALERLNDTAMGILLMVDAGGVLIRTLTDGDLRRLILSGCSLHDSLDLLPEKSPLTLTRNDSPDKFLDLMNQMGINQIPVVDEESKVIGIVYRNYIDTRILLSTPHMGEDEKNYVADAFNTNWIAPVGPNINAFEQAMADKINVKYAVALSSGTAALHLALRVLGVGRGDYVFCSSFTFVASANPVLYMGAEPVFIDSDPETWNMSASALQRAFDNAITQNKLPKAVIVVNLYGQSADYDPICTICDRYNVPIIEDAAESLGATYKNKASGTLGLVGVYSFNGNKIITTSGGGMLVSNNQELVNEARFLSTQALEPVGWYEHKSMGYNYRMSNILAGIGRGQLKVLDDRVSARREIFKRYVDLLADRPELQWMPEVSYGKSTHWLTAALINKNNVNLSEVVSFMAQQGIEIRRLWKPMHLQPLFSNSDYYAHKDKYSISDELFVKGFCLPSSSHLTIDQQERVSSTLRTALDKFAC